MVVRRRRDAPAAAAAARGRPLASVLRSIGEGLRFVRRNQALMGSFAIDLMAMTFGMPRALFPVLAVSVYGAGAAGTGLLFAAVSAGATVAALTTGWLAHARRLGRDHDLGGARVGRGDRAGRADAGRCGRRRRCSRSPARPTA